MKKNNRDLIIIFYFLTTLFCISNNVFSQAEIFSLEGKIMEIFEKNKNSIVRVKAVSQTEDDDEKPKIYAGTGFFVSQHGHIITNAIVVYQARRVWIEYEKQYYSAEVVGFDSWTNLSLLQLVKLPEVFTHIEIKETEMPQTGSIALRISAPFSFGASPSYGIISGFDNSFGSRIFPCAYIRTTIPSGPGEGGSPLLSSNGDLIGIMVASLPELKGSYALPSYALKSVYNDLKVHGKINYGWLGFDIVEKYSKKYNRIMVINKIENGSPAMKSGLKESDTLLALNQIPIKSPHDLNNVIFLTRTNDDVRIRIRRETGIYDYNIVLTSQPINNNNEDESLDTE